MVIGFMQRRQTVSESQAAAGTDGFTLVIDIRSQRTSEQQYEVLFRVREGVSTAIVEATSFQFNTNFDAIFGNRQDNEEREPIEDARDLVAGSLELRTPLNTFIRNDFLAEDEECYTIGIQSPDVDGVRDIFDCFEDDYPNATNFFCFHTICIEDDDGKYT